MLKKINAKKLAVTVLSGFLLVETPWNSAIITKAEEQTMETEMDADQTVSDYFDDFFTKVEEIDAKQALEDGKEALADGFITIVDFFCYDGEIKGYTKDELTESGLQKVEETWEKIDEKIEKKFPNYKDYIKENYEKAKDWSLDKIDQALDFGSELKDKAFDKIEDTIGEENYNKIGDAYESAKEKVKEGASDLKDFATKGKEKVKSLYENFRSNH